MRQQVDSTWEARGGEGDLRGQAQTRQVSRTGTVRPATKTVASVLTHADPRWALLSPALLGNHLYLHL